MNLTREYFESAGITVWQPAGGHRYGEESLALAEFASIPEGAKVAELGSGSGLISLLIAARARPSHVVAVEIQPEFHEIALRNAHENRFSGTVHCINDDHRNFAAASEASSTVSGRDCFRTPRGRNASSTSPSPAR